MRPWLLGVVCLVVLLGGGRAGARSFVRFGSGGLPFQEGTKLRGDAAAAREHFILAALHYQGAWDAGHRTPAWALNRGRAHFLAGNLPGAVRAFRDGLAHAPWDADLQAGLAHCRTRVAYPTPAEPAERVRPDPLTALRHRVSPADLFVAAAVGSLLVTAGLATRLTTRPGWSTPVTAVGAVVVLAVAAVAVKLELDAAADHESPVRVVAADTVLRSGNGTTFDARLPSPLPRGAEVRELRRRGGWVQVGLPGGAVGWLPEAAVI